VGQEDPQQHTDLTGSSSSSNLEARHVKSALIGGGSRHHPEHGFIHHFPYLHSSVTLPSAYTTNRPVVITLPGGGGVLVSAVSHVVSQSTARNGMISTSPGSSVRTFSYIMISIVIYWRV